MKEAEIAEAARPLTAIPRAIKPLPPNNILIAEEMPEICDKPFLENLFRPYVGLREVRVIPTKSVAFVEFENEGQAQVALERLNNYPLSSTHLLFLNFALK